MAQAQARAPDHFPRIALWGAAGVIALSIALAAAGQRQARLPPASTDAFDLTKPTAVTLLFDDLANGGVAVLDGETGASITTLAPGSNGFVRGVMRGLARERRLHGLDRTKPFSLARWPDGRLTLDDPATGRHIELAPFGATNQAAFGELWATARAAASARRTKNLGGEHVHADHGTVANH